MNEQKAAAGKVVGDKLYFHTAAAEPALEAEITQVWSEFCVNIEYLGADGEIQSPTSVPIVRPGMPVPSGYYCTVPSDDWSAENAAQDPNPPARPVVAANLTRLEAAQALPELRGDANLDPVEFAPGSIQRFKSEDRRTMQVVAIGGALACMEVTHG